ncbi:unnamed protein product, partial [Cladocopium goreaui]
PASQSDLRGILASPTLPSLVAPGIHLPHLRTIMLAILESQKKPIMRHNDVLHLHNTITLNLGERPGLAHALRALAGSGPLGLRDFDTQHKFERDQGIFDRPDPGSWLPLDRVQAVLATPALTMENLQALNLPGAPLSVLHHSAGGERERSARREKRTSVTIMGGTTSDAALMQRVAYFGDLAALIFEDFVSKCRGLLHEVVSLVKGVTLPLPMMAGIVFIFDSKHHRQRLHACVTCEMPIGREAQGIRG